MESSRQDADNKKPRSATNGATGSWSATEDYMMNQDASMVKDFADDVDTLLVFAGLFSAVLTAFVVESYQQLQADHAERTTQLLARISLQLESFTFTQGFLNSTAPALPLPARFTPQSSALWINVLWFLSLLFSLAAALFGILAKQWLREYLKWYSTVASPRENILVRQIRFEAWNEWNVAASISTIPALLELALVLFVCGLVVLLWTLDIVVAIVFTVATAIFLIIVSSFTLLPAIFKRCPYKSPTAWACALAFDFIGDAARYCANYARLYLGRVDMIYSGQLRWKLAHWRTHARTWRERDIANITASSVRDSRGKEQDAIAVMHEELASELVHLDDTGNLEGDPMFERVTLDAVDQTLHAVAHLTLLFRALTWVSLASQDSRIQEQVTRCATSMHSISAIYEGTRANISEVLGTNGVRNVSVWFLLSRSWPSRRVPRDLPDTVTDRTMVTTALRQCVRRGYSMQHIGEEGDKGAMVFKMHWDALEQEWAGLPSRFWEYVPQETLIITYLLASDIRTTVVKLLSFYYGHKDRNIRARRAVELICALWLVLLSNPNVWPTCMSLVVETYNAVIKSARRGWFEHSFPGLRSALLELIWQFMLVGISSDEQLVTYAGTAQWGMTAVNYGTLALKLDTISNRDDQHIFVQAVAHYLRTFEFDTTPTTEDQDHGLIEKMCALLEGCLESSTPNAGCYGDIPWPQRLRELSPEVINAVRTARPQEFRRLVELLMQSNKAGLITGEARTHLDAWLDTLAEARSLTESWSGGRGREDGSSISGAVSRSTSRGDGRRRQSEAGRRHRAHSSTASGTSSAPSAPPPVPSKAPPHDGTRATGAHSSSG